MALMARYAEPAGTSPATMEAAYHPNTALNNTTGLIDEYAPAKGGYRRGPRPGVQYAGGGPSEEEPGRELGPNGQELSDVEVFRVRVYRSERARLEEIDPQNPILHRSYFVGPNGFVPSQAEVDELAGALANARANGRTPEGSANTFADPVDPATGPSQDQLDFDIKQIDISRNIKQAIDSPDAAKQLEGQVAKFVRDLGINVSRFNMKFGTGGSIGEIDVETDKVIIEVTLEPQGKMGQLERFRIDPIMNPGGKPVILFAPRYEDLPSNSAIRGGFFVARNYQDLASILRQVGH